MGDVAKEFLRNYEIQTLRDVDFQGQTPDRNALLKYDDNSGKWVPSKLTSQSFQVVQEITEELKVFANEVLFTHDPDLSNYGATIEGTMIVL